MIPFPDSLRALPNWVLWKVEERDGRQTKVPYSAVYDGRASSVNPNTWTTFDVALDKAAEAAGEYSGLGLVVTRESGLIFIDIDHCIHNRSLSEESKEILRHFSDQYIEVSQSGTGIHVLTKGSLPKSFKNTAAGVEAYSEKRFVALTGRVLRGHGNDPHEDQEALDWLVKKYGPVEVSRDRDHVPPERYFKSDRKIISLATKREKKFPVLFGGDWRELYGSQSEADEGLCTILAFWTDCDSAAMDRIFRQSKLYRSKWERKDYRERTIGGAIAHCDTTISEWIRNKNREEVKQYYEEHSHDERQRS